MRSTAAKGRGRLRARLAAALLLPPLTAATACQLIAGIEQRSYPADATTDARSLEGAAPPKDATTEPAVEAAAEADADAGSSPGCGSGLPARPTNTPAGLMSFAVAIHDSYFATDAGVVPPDLGFDMDCVETCIDTAQWPDGGPGSCQPYASDQPPSCDLEGGVDLAGNALALNANEFGSSSGQEDLDDNIAAGKENVLLRVTSWNGTPNDSSVTVAVFISDGLLGDGGVEAGAVVPPSWNGNDEWSIDPRSSATMHPSIDDAGDYVYVPTVFDNDAYLSDGQLVFTVPSATFFLDGVLIPVNDARFVGTVAPFGDAGWDAATGFSIVGKIAFRASVNALLDGLRFIEVQNQYLCGNALLFQVARQEICPAADIMTDKTKDNAGAVCDAVSFAYGFTGWPAKFGPVWAGIPVKAGCADAGFVPCPGTELPEAGGGP